MATENHKNQICTKNKLQVKQSKHNLHPEVIVISRLLRNEHPKNTSGDTARKHSKVIPYLLAAHTFSGCDTVAHLLGIGKASSFQSPHIYSSLKS